MPPAQNFSFDQVVQELFGAIIADRPRGPEESWSAETRVGIADEYVVYVRRHSGLGRDMTTGWRSDRDG